MKNLRSILLLGALGVASIFTACDNMEEDVPPTNSSNIIVNHDYYSTTKNQGVVFNVLTNDSIGSNAAITFGQPANGTVQAGNTPGTVSYLPQNNFIGIDSFSYQACIGGDCASAKVFMEVRDTTGSCTSLARLDSVNVNKNEFKKINILQNDITCADTSNFGTVTLVRLPRHGHATINQFGQLIYYPALNYTGPDDLQYKLTNSKGTSTADVLIHVRPNGPCTVDAAPDMVTLVHNLPIDSTAINVLQNDTWCQNGTFPVISLPFGQQTNYGSLWVINNGINSRIVYFTNTPAHNVNDTFTYRICQGPNCDNATVTVHIQ